MNTTLRLYWIKKFRCNS